MYTTLDLRRVAFTSIDWRTRNDQVGVWSTRLRLAPLPLFARICGLLKALQLRKDKLLIPHMQRGAIL